MSTTNLLVWQLILLFWCYCLADVSHLFVGEYPGIQYFHNIPQTAQNNLETVYGAPPIQNHVPEVTPIIVPATSTSEFVLPEVVDNRQAKERANFIPLRNYYLPPNRPNFESLKPPQPIYIPPVREDVPFTGSHSGPYNYEKPRTTTTTTRPDPIVVLDTPTQVFGYNYQAPAVSTPASDYLPPKDTTLNMEKLSITQSQVKIQEMRCLKDNAGYFRAILKMQNNLSELPLVDNDSHHKHCQVKQTQGFLVIDIPETDFTQCGITNCGKDLCLRLRFPTIAGLRTALDDLLTLHCKTQQRVTEKRFSLKMGVTNDVQARSLGAYAQGGSQNAFRTHVELLRKTANGFTRHLAEKETVQLGEELLLRAHVLAGDGWNYTKLTDVSIERVTTSGETLHVVHLINTYGCVNPTMLSICPQAPTFDPPLGHKLHFKAVMFHGMRSGDELILSMRISGCLELQDCHAQQQQCNFNSASYTRRKRNTSILGTRSNHTNLEASEISRISFRVAFDETERNATIRRLNLTDKSSLRNTERDIVLMGVLGFVILLICLGIFMSIIHKYKKHDLNI